MSRIVLSSVLAGVVYGIIHNLVTAHVCVQYFTLAHPRIIESESPVALAFLWGVIATWWVGLGLGLALALATRMGSRPKLEVGDVLPGIVKLLMFAGCAALLAGFLGYYLAESGRIWLKDPLASKIPKMLHSRFFFSAFAHGASYIIGFLGGLVLIVRTWLRRKRDGNLK